MTVDAVALCRDRPDVPAVLAALLAAGPALRVQPIERGRLVQLCADGPLVTIEGPTPVQVPSEVERLLGLVVDGPVWWVEQSRPLVGLGTLLTDALATAGGRQVALVTLISTRITYPLQATLSGGPHRWVVRGAPFVDGLTGAPVRWDGEAFVDDGPAPDLPAPSAGPVANPPGSAANAPPVRRRWSWGPGRGPSGC